MPAQPLLFAALCALSPWSALDAGGGDAPTLDVTLTSAHVRMTVEGHDQIFIGAVLGSLSPTLEHYLTGLPPLLGESVILGAGVGWPDGGYLLELPQALLPAGVPIFVQGATLLGGEVRATEVDGFTL